MAEVQETRGQRAEHYDIAAYDCLIAWARVMEHKESADLLQQTLDEVRAANKGSKAAATT